MSFGQGPAALQDLFETEWQATRAGREDVPPIVSGDPKLNNGVLVSKNREVSRVDKARHDLIHCYHPETAGLTITDRGYSEQNVVETVQIDISLTDRTDQSGAEPERLGARTRMIGDRDENPTVGEPPYPGIFGEVKYILETVRRGTDEYDTVSHDVVRSVLGNSNADISLNVELERISDPTVQ